MKLKTKIATGLAACLLAATSTFNVTATATFDAQETEATLFNAVSKGDIDKIKDLLEHGTKISDDMVCLAVNWGNMDLVKYLVEHSATICDGAVSSAIASGNMDMNLVKYLVEEQSAKIGDDAVCGATYSGNVDVVKYLVDHGAKIGYAIVFSNLDVVKYLVEESGAKIDDYAVFNAVSSGNIDVVKYLVEHGAKIDDRMICHANDCAYTDIARYLDEQVKKNNL